MHHSSGLSTRPSSTPADPEELTALRLSAPQEIAGWLNELLRREVPLDLQTTGPLVKGALLLAMDTRQLVLRVESDRDLVRAITQAGEVVVTGHLDGIKMHFSVPHLEARAGGQELRGPVPDALYRWQRRGAFRVRPPQYAAPVARVRVNQGPLTPMRVLDVSVSGCALFVPFGTISAPKGLVFERVQLNLDPETQLVVDLRVLRSMPPDPGARGWRIGCQFIDPPTDVLRALQRFIDTTQKRERLLAADD